jgi:transposase
VIGLSRRVRVFAYTRAVDMRKQYDGLYALVVSELNADPLSGDLFLFTNRRRDRMTFCISFLETWQFQCGDLL